MKKILGIVVISLFFMSNIGYSKTTICEITFIVQNTRYDGLLVLNDSNIYGNNYMRVGYNLNGNYIIINQQLNFQQQMLPDGNTYATLSGYNVKFITNNFGSTYNPDKFSVLINAVGVIDQPKIGDENNEMRPVNSFKDVTNQYLDYNYLKRFFLDGEPQLYGLSVTSFGNQQVAETQNYGSNFNSTNSSINNSINNSISNSIGNSNNYSNKNSTQIEFYNNTGTEISACYAYYNNEDRCWTSVGWYTVPPYRYKTIDIGNYTGNLYIRGRQGLLNEWGSGDGQFCVDATQAFNIKFADTKNCFSKKKFSKCSVNPGINKWTFN
jgi:hypothetical protein